MTHITEAGLSFVSVQDSETNTSERQNNNTPMGDPNGENFTSEEQRDFLTQKERALTELKKIGIDPLHILPEKIWDEVKKNLIQIYGLPHYPLIKINLDVLESVKAIAEKRFSGANRAFTIFALLLITVLAIMSTAEVMAITTLLWCVAHGIVFWYRHDIIRHFMAWELKKNMSGYALLRNIAKEGDRHIWTEVMIPPTKNLAPWTKMGILELNGVPVFVHAAREAIRFISDPVGLLLREYDQKHHNRFNHLRVMEMNEVDRKTWLETCPIMWVSLHGVVAIIAQWGDTKYLEKALEL